MRRLLRIKKLGRSRPSVPLFFSILLRVDSGREESAGGLPDVLIICATVRQQSTLRPRIGRAVDSADTDQCFYITNRPLLTELAFNDAIWQNVVDPIELVALA